MGRDWSIRRANCDYCGGSLVVLRIGPKFYSEWRYRADGWIGAEGHEAYHQAVEGDLREEVRRERSGS